MDHRFLHYLEQTQHLDDLWFACSEERKLDKIQSPTTAVGAVCVGEVEFRMFEGRQVHQRSGENFQQICHWTKVCIQPGPNLTLQFAVPNSDCMQTFVLVGIVQPQGLIGPIMYKILPCKLVHLLETRETASLAVPPVARTHEPWIFHRAI
jgi:hypothetical protein